VRTSSNAARSQQKQFQGRDLQQELEFDLRPHQGLYTIFVFKTCSICAWQYQHLTLSELCPTETDQFSLEMAHREKKGLISEGFTFIFRKRVHVHLYTRKENEI
jgi:hypothetical protein